MPANKLIKECRNEIKQLERQFYEWNGNQWDCLSSQNKFQIETLKSL